MDYRILLYYHYTSIEDPSEFAKEHLAFCKSLELKGRILVANEGINGTVSGTVEQTNAYMEAMKGHPAWIRWAQAALAEPWIVPEDEA